MAEGRYSKVSRENDQLEICLKVTEVALHATEEETSVIWTRLAKVDAMVAGKFHFFERKRLLLPLNLDSLLIPDNPLIFYWLAQMVKLENL
jgi:hypothetical protein